MIRSGMVDPTQTLAGGDDSITGALTNLAEEKPLGPGRWAMSADQDFSPQLNSGPGEGLGAHPPIYWGFANFVSSGLHVYYDGNTFCFRVPAGTTVYLVFRKSFFFVSDGLYTINRIED